MKGLIIDEPWIGFILSGRKTWEMRSRNTQIRGRIGLIRKGSKMVVGVADLVDTVRDLSLRRSPERGNAGAAPSLPYALNNLNEADPKPIAGLCAAVDVSLPSPSSASSGPDR